MSSSFSLPPESSEGRTPVAAVLRILTLLRKPDQKAIASDRRLAEAVRRRARLLLGEE